MTDYKFSEGKTWSLTMRKVNSYTVWATAEKIKYSMTISISITLQI